MKHEFRLCNARLAFAAVAVAFASLSFPCSAQAEDGHGNGDNVKMWAPLGVSFLTPVIQVPGEGHSVFGAMVNLGAGEVRDAYFLNPGLFNSVDRTMAGVQLGLYNKVKTGYGVQGAFVNYSDKFCGVQVGVLNLSSAVDGLQVGLFNFGYDLRGVQIGLLNVSEGDGGQSCMIGGITVLPILNMRF